MQFLIYPIHRSGPTVRTVRETNVVAGLARVQYWPRWLRSLATPATKTGHLLIE